jgi:hypothetical protein
MVDLLNGRHGWMVFECGASFFEKKIEKRFKTTQQLKTAGSD